MIFELDNIIGRLIHCFLLILQYRLFLNIITKYK